MLQIKYKDEWSEKWDLSDKKIWMTINEIAQDLADENFWKKFLDDDERSEA